LHLAWRGALAARQRSPVVLAHHEWSADPHAAALELLERAATQAERAGDAPGVVRWRGRALERARELGEPDDRRRLARGFGEALAQVGAAQRAEAAFREALGDGAADPRGEALARRGLGRLEVLRNHLELARMELRRGFEKALAANDAGLIADLALELGDVLGRMGRPREAAQALSAALEHVGARPEFAWRVELAQAARAPADGSH